MSKETKHLKLFGYEATDGDQTFNLDKGLNENWEKIDGAVKILLNEIETKLDLSGGTLSGKLAIKSAVPTLEFEEAATGKKFYLVIDGSTISIREDSLTGASFPLNFDGATNVLTTLGNKIWHEGNDGAGSGLDADKLDGKQATDFSPNTLKGSITVNNASWVLGSYGDGKIFRKSVPITGVTATDTVGFYPTLATKVIAKDACVDHLEGYAGGVYLYSESIPSGSITFDYRVIK